VDFAHHAIRGMINGAGLDISLSKKLVCICGFSLRL
jgi:hypothetical protein